MTKPKPVTVAQMIAGLAGGFADAEAAKSKARHDSIAAGRKRRQLSGKYGRDVCGKRKP